VLAMCGGRKHEKVVKKWTSAFPFIQVNSSSYIVLLFVLFV